MLPVSSQSNYNKFNLHNDLDSSPIAYILVHTDRTQIAGNYITLGIPDSLRINAALGPLNTYVTERLQNLGARLVTSIEPWSNEVFGREPAYIKVANYIDARRVIDHLFINNEMSHGDRADLENSLRELEKSAQFASKCAESISTAQKDVIQSGVSLYIDDIKSEAPDSQTAKRWIQCAANALRIAGPNAKNNLSYFLWTACTSGHDKSHSFYESLFAISQIYSSMGNLEGALEQLGVALPSKALVEQAVLELFD